MLRLDHFKNKQPKNRHKKLSITIFLIGSFLISTIIIYTYIINPPLSDLPTIKIITEDTPNYDNYVNCTFELESNKDAEDISSIKSKIRMRGSGAGWNKYSPKKGYRIELSTQLSLLGLRKDDDWLLFSLYMDYPRTRVKLSMELWRNLQSTNPTAILPNSKYVCLYVDGEFQGLYLLAEKNDRKLFELDDAQNNLNTSLIFQAKQESNLGLYDYTAWQQDWPNEDEDIFVKDTILGELSNFIKNSTNDKFFSPTNGIYTKFSKENLIDFYIFNYFIDHQDFWNHNYFIVRNSYPEKFYLIPWDFDMSFGQYIWKKYDVNVNRESEIRRLNGLYNRLLGNISFREECKNRWFELREKIWADEVIMNIISDIYEEIYPILEVDVNMWNMRSPILFREERVNDLDESIKYLYDWINERLGICDLYFSNM